MMPDRSWEMGLHQMIEAKEDVEISGQRKTLARISYQRFYNRYLRLCGMTGTAREVRHELLSVYGLHTVRVPTRRPVQRRPLPHRIFATEEEQWSHVAQSAREISATGRPVLIGTLSVAESERLSEIFEGAEVVHELLNARQDARESEIVSQAGRRGQVTIATNMAGRGTDIKLEAEVLELGGLHVISSGRSDAGRIDRQLYGRCGRQGDPGTYECVDSLEDQRLVHRHPTWLLSGVVVLLRRRGGLGRRIAKRLVIRAQRQTEKKHRMQRKELMRVEEYLEHALAFAGPSD
jgi:preprotein translocase subunit SecA